MNNVIKCRSFHWYEYGSHNFIATRPFFGWMHFDVKYIRTCMWLVKLTRVLEFLLVFRSKIVDHSFHYRLDQVSMTLSINISNKKFDELNYCFYFAIHTLSFYYKNKLRKMKLECVLFVSMIFFLCSIIYLNKQ